MKNNFELYLEDQPKSQHEVVVLLKPLEGEVKFLTRLAPLLTFPETVVTTIVGILVSPVILGAAVVDKIRKLTRREDDKKPMVKSWEWLFEKICRKPEKLLTHHPEKMGFFRSVLNSKRLAKHGAIFVYGIIYDFSEEGLVRLQPTSVKLFRKKMPVGRTRKKWTEFEAWISSCGDRYTATGYHSSTNNCLQFVEAACHFLGVRVPDSLQFILDWVDGRGAEHLEKAQAAASIQNPSSTASSLPITNDQ